MTRALLVVFAGLFGAIGIAARAYEAHGILALPGLSEARLRDFSSGTEILLMHAVALLGIAGLSTALPRASAWAGGALAVGTALFAIPLLLFGLCASRALIMLTPFGGVLMIAGWVALAICGIIAVLKAKKPH